MSVQSLVDVWRLTRRQSVWATSTTLGILGILCALSFGPLADVTIFGKGFFDLFDYATSNIGMPLGCLGLAIVGGMVAWKDVKEELETGSRIGKTGLTFLRLIMVVLSPIVIVLVTFKAIGLF